MSGELVFGRAEENSVRMCLLFDFYGAMLTARQQEIFDLYYNDDLSLSEISETVGVTRQGARDAVARARNILSDMEEKLGLVGRFLDMTKDFEKIRTLSDELLVLNREYMRSRELDDKLWEISETAKKYGKS